MPTANANGNGIGMTPTSGSGFSPLNISGLDFWLRADAETYNTGTTPATDGQAVTTWGDQSANNNDAAAVLTQKPLWRATGGANSKPAVEFDGSDDVMTFGTNITGNTKTIIAVLNHTAILGGYSAALRLDSLYLLLELTTVGNVWGTYLTGNVSSGVTLNSTFVVISMVVRAANDVDLVTNGSLVNVTTGTSFNISTTISTIGASATALQPMTGKICEMITYDSALSNSNRRNVEVYLGSKYGIAIS